MENHLWQQEKEDGKGGGVVALLRAYVKYLKGI